jgi:hypothetical protein
MHIQQQIHNDATIDSNCKYVGLFLVQIINTVKNHQHHQPYPRTETHTICLV